MIRIHQVKCEDPKEIESRLLKKLNMPKKDLLSWSVHRKSVDARGQRVLFSFVIDAEVRHEKKYLKNRDVTIAPDETFRFEATGTEPLAGRPVVAGFGPAGLFAALLLAQYGYKPIIIERGAPIEERQKDVERFWKEGVLDPESNVQFGMGGAGAFSDGKLTTRSKDLRTRKIFDELVRFGANKNILYEQHPHVGTDGFVSILKNARAEIESLGGTFLFHTRLAGLGLEKLGPDGHDVLQSITLKGSGIENTRAILKEKGLENLIVSSDLNDSNEKEDFLQIRCMALIAAIGHSAGDTLRMLAKSHVQMENKPFAIGVRIEHDQKFIDQAMLKDHATDPLLIPARYQVTAKTSTGKGVYSFCMCPGGYVIAASSTPETVVVNGMSYHDRGGKNANAALLVQVDETDTGSDLFAGLDYQEQLEKAAWKLSNSYQAPVQLASDFVQGNVSDHFEGVLPTYPLGTVFTDFQTLLPAPIASSLKEALLSFEEKIPGFLDGALLTGVETRSSSAIRVFRDKESLLSSVYGLYPCGEGAGYSGGIMTSALDGLRCAMALMERFDNSSKSPIQ